MLSLQTIFLSFPFIFILDYNLFFLALNNSQYGQTFGLKNKSLSAVVVLHKYLNYFCPKYRDLSIQLMGMWLPTQLCSRQYRAAP